MAIDTYIVRFSPDGHATATPALSIIPGVDATWECEANTERGGAATLIDLTDAFLVMEISKAGGIVLLQEDTPFFALTEPESGCFEMRFTAAMTAFIPPDTYVLEVKARLRDGTRKRIAYLDSLTVAPSSLATII